MCWSLGVSAGMVAVGAAGAVWTARRDVPKALPLTLGYFAFMEGLQAAGYFVVGQCGTPGNATVTLLSYLHIAFQPFFINALALSFIPPDVRINVRRGAYGVCIFATLIMLLQLLPWEWAGQCRPGETLCGKQLCLRWGEWHIAWDVPYNGLMRWFDDLVGANFGLPTYVLAAYVVPILYGSWRFTIFHGLAGPILAGLLTRDPSEAPAIWCLFSIAIIVAAMFPPLVNAWHVKSWPLWPKRWAAA
ncbi:MAG: DUF5765 domain-containing protein [Hyphomicrobiaceae bacterium]